MHIQDITLSQQMCSFLIRRGSNSGFDVGVLKKDPRPMDAVPSFQLPMLFLACSGCKSIIRAMFLSHKIQCVFLFKISSHLFFISGRRPFRCDSLGYQVHGDSGQGHGHGFGQCLAGKAPLVGTWSQLGQCLAGKVPFV